MFRHADRARSGSSRQSPPVTARPQRALKYYAACLRGFGSFRTVNGGGGARGMLLRRGLPRAAKHVRREDDGPNISSGTTFSISTICSVVFNSCIFNRPHYRIPVIEQASHGICTASQATVTLKVDHELQTAFDNWHSQASGRNTHTHTHTHTHTERERERERAKVFKSQINIFKPD